MSSEVKTDGFAFVEFVSEKPGELVERFENLGFRVRGKAQGDAHFMTQGAAALCRVDGCHRQCGDNRKLLISAIFWPAQRDSNPRPSA